MKNQIILIGLGSVFKDINQAVDYYKNFDIDLVNYTYGYCQPNII